MRRIFRFGRGLIEMIFPWIMPLLFPLPSLGGRMASRRKSRAIIGKEDDGIPDCDDPDAFYMWEPKHKPILLPWGVYVTP